MDFDKAGIAPNVAATSDRKGWHAPVLTSFDASDAEAGPGPNPDAAAGQQS